MNGIAILTSGYHLAPGPSQQPSSIACAATMRFNRAVAVGWQCGGMGVAGGWQSEIGRSSEDFGDLGEPPITQLSRCCFPATRLSSESCLTASKRSRATTDRWPAAVEFELFLKTLAAAVLKCDCQLPITNSAAWATSWFYCFIAFF